MLRPTENEPASKSHTAGNRFASWYNTKDSMLREQSSLGLQHAAILNKATEFAECGHISSSDASTVRATARLP